LIQRMEMRPMVRGADLHEHSNDDSEEPRQFRHGDTLHRRHVGFLFVGPTLYVWTVPTGVAACEPPTDSQLRPFTCARSCLSNGTSIKGFQNNDLGDSMYAAAVDWRRQPTLGHRWIGGARHSSYRTECSYADWVRRFLGYLTEREGAPRPARRLGIGPRLPHPPGGAAARISEHAGEP
jgi:hypothetical protein